MKLQDAYAAESNKLGTWKLIGYTAPGTKAGDNDFSTTNFQYTGSADDAQPLEGDEGAKITDAWKATALVALNDCKKGESWSIEVEGKPDAVTYKGSYSDENNCEALTPNFTNIGTKKKE